MTLRAPQFRAGYLADSESNHALAVVTSSKVRREKRVRACFGNNPGGRFFQNTLPSKDDRDKPFPFPRELDYVPVPL